MLPPLVMAVDPGMMTGVFRCGTPEYMIYPDVFFGNWPESGRLPFRCDEYPFHEACAVIEETCAAGGPRIAVLWERFTIRPDTHKKTPQPDAMHVIGVCRYLARKYGCRVLAEAQQHTPKPRDAERLKALGWWIPGKDDAQSAACHMLLYLERSGSLPPREREILAGLTGRQD